jgi:SAM-dependent methyltransferase
MRKGYYPLKQPVGKNRNETQWTKVSLERAVPYCETDYMNSVFLDYLPSSGHILEAGCGLGYYVIYYKDRGYDIYGLEWVSETLLRAKSYKPDAGLITGDVYHLPFRDKSFKLYFSGAVIEHFEGGPHQVLREAHRVLDDDGLLLIKVPWMNAVRRLEDFVDFTLRRKTLKSTVQDKDREMVYKPVETFEVDSAPLEGYHFHEYYFRKRVLSCILEETGFQVLTSHGVGLEPGLLDFPWFRTMFMRFWPDQRTDGNPPSSGALGRNDSTPTRTPNAAGLRRRLKKLLVSEAAESPPAKALLRLLQGLFGQYLLFVCKKLP